MNYRLNTKMLTGAALLVGVAIALFAYTLVSAPTQEENTIENVTPIEEQVEEYLLTAKHRFEEGIHTIAGVVSLPTSCHTLVAEPFFIGEGDTVVEIRFSTALEGETCTTVVTEVPFHVSFEAPENVSIQATWNGGAARLNLIPLQPGENLEDTLYIKG